MVNKLSRAVSVVLTAALVLAAPGPQAWSAVATRVSVTAPVSAQTGIHGAAGSYVPAATLSLPQSALSVPGGVLAAPALTPTLTPTVSPAASAAAVKAGAQAAATQPTASFSRPGESAPLAAPRQVDPELGAPAAPAAVDATVAATQEAAASGEVASAVEQGRMAAPSSKIASGLAALKRAFGFKRAETTPASSGSAVEAAQASSESSSKSGLSKATDQPQTKSGEDQPPVPPGGNDGKDQKEPGGKSWFGLGKTAVFFIGALLVAQIGVEALGVAMPTLMQKTFGDFTAVAQLAIFSSVASIIGRQLGSVITEKFGLRKTYLGATTIRLLSMTALVTLLAMGHMTLPLMIGFYSINGLLGGVAITAEASIPPALVGKDQAKIERFWTVEQTLLEVLGFLGPIAFGAIVGGMGFMPALIAFPVTFAAALGIMFMTLRIPQKVEMARQADLKKKQDANGGKPSSVGSVFKEFFRRIGHGFQLVWHNPVLRTAFLGYTAIMILNPFLYSMIAPAFGLRLLGPEAAELATGVSGWLTGLYSLGGLLGGLVMMREQKKIKDLPEAAQNEKLRQSMMKWMKWTAVSLAAMLTLALPLPMLGSMIALPSFMSWAGTLTLPALALIPYGIAQVISMVKLKSFFQSQVPNAEKEMPSAMGFFGSASLAVSTLGLLGLKYLFKGFAGFTPFWILAGLMIPLAVYYLYATRQLNKATAPKTDGEKK